MMVCMKLRVVGSIIVAAALVAAGAAQNQPNPEKSVKKDPLAFVKIAADVAGHVQHDTVNGSLAIYLDEQNWAAGLKDSDLGPFLKVKEAKPGRSAACLFSPAKDAAVCVYFDGDSAFGVAAVRAGSSGKIEPSEITAAYKPVSNEMLKKGDEELKFSESDVATDDGQPLPAFVVTATSKAKS
jgi:hypothetical protein